MCGGGPPPAPDYTEQNNQLIDDTIASNNRLADQWTSDVSAFNNALSGEGGFNERLTNFTNTLNNLDMTSLWDDPNTEQNENPFQNLLSQGNQLQLDFNALSTLGDGPDFETRVLGGGGEILDIPDIKDTWSLDWETPVGTEAGANDQTAVLGGGNGAELSDKFWNPNTDLYGTIGSGISSALDRLNSLNSDRQAEEARVSSFGGDMYRDLTRMNSRFGQLGIADSASMDSLENDLASLSAERDLFQSDILDQMGGFSQSNALFDQLGTGLSDLRAARAAEEGRIADFESQLLSASDSIYNQLSGATIADGDLLNDLQGQLTNNFRDANRFSSELGFDLSQEMSELNALNSKLTSLQNERGAEQSRIDGARDSFRDRARSLEDMFSNGTIYDAARLDQYGSMLSDLQSDMGNFSSDLGFDFTGLDGNISSAQSALDGLRTERAGVIDPLFDQLAALEGEAGGLALEDVDGRADLMARVHELRGTASPYAGGRIDTLSGNIDGLLDTIQGQTDALGTRRGEINTQAEDLLEQIRGGSYMSEADVAAGRGQMADLQALVDQFGVDSASDEMAGMSDFLQSQTNRIQQDQQNLAARERMGQQQAQSQLAGGQLEQLINSSNLTDEEIQQLVQMLGNEDDPQVQQLLGTFSSNLGV